MTMVGDRSPFPHLETAAYLNHAAISPPSRAMVEVVGEVVGDYARRGTGAFGRWQKQRERLRAKLADLVGAETAADIGFVPNTTRGVTDIALCLAWNPGDRVLLFRGEFPANTTPWQRAAELFGLEIVWADLPPARGSEPRWLEELERTLASGIRLTAISAVQFQTGLRMPLARIAERCRASDAQLFVDGIQACGVVPMEVAAWGIDYLSCGSHKWLMGLEGCGFLYVHPRRVGELRPAVAGWLSHDGAMEFLFEGPGKLRYDRPLRLRADFVEGGMGPTVVLAALEAAVDPLLELGTDAILFHVGAYLDALEGELEARGFSSVRALEPERRSGILSVEPPPGVDVIALHRAIDPRVVACATPDGLLRFAPHWPNALAEIPAVVTELEAALKRIG